MKYRLTLLVLGAFLALSGSSAWPIQAQERTQPKQGQQSELPDSIKKHLVNEGFKTFEGTVNSIVAQPPFVRFGVINPKEGVHGFSVDAADKRNEYLIKIVFMSLEHKNNVSVTYKLPGDEVIAIVIR